MTINNPRSSEENVKYLRELATETHYIYRGVDINNKHDFDEVKFEIWAPEEDTAVYYGRYKSPAMGVTRSEDRRRKPKLLEYIPPAGVDAGAFYNLIEGRRKYVDALLSIDQAKNNTSIVFCMEWRGWRLLFTGDAEIKSWKIMRDKNVLKPIHFLKISHHGSNNGTPPDKILEKILPEDRKNDNRPRQAVVSTYANTHHGVPDADTLIRIYDPASGENQPRCDQLFRVDENFEELYLDIKFPG